MPNPADTLHAVIQNVQPDTVVLNAFRNDPDLDYSREVMRDGRSLWDIITAQLNEWLSRLLGQQGVGVVPQWVWIMLALVAMGFIVYFFVAKHPEWYFKWKKKEKPVDDEDNIYGVDFEREIAKARKKGNWRRVVRLIHLQTLRWLADAGLIDWRPSKTPTQYTREVMSREFAEMTRHFLRVRYGNFPADEALAGEMLRLQAIVKSEEKPAADTGDEDGAARRKEKGGRR